VKVAGTRILEDDEEKRREQGRSRRESEVGGTRESAGV